jgi:hypothetical protein
MGWLRFLIGWLTKSLESAIAQSGSAGKVMAAGQVPLTWRDVLLDMRSSLIGISQRKASTFWMIMIMCER